MRSCARWFALLLFVGCRGSAEHSGPRAKVVRLVDRLADARRVSQHAELIEPETLHLQPGTIAAPPGWRLSPPDLQIKVVGHFVRDRA